MSAGIAPAAVGGKQTIRQHQAIQGHGTGSNGHHASSVLCIERDVGSAVVVEVAVDRETFIDR